MRSDQTMPKSEPLNAIEQLNIIELAKSYIPIFGATLRLLTMQLYPSFIGISSIFDKIIILFVHRHEIKEERFQTVATRRVNNVIKSLSSLQVFE